MTVVVDFGAMQVDAGSFNVPLLTSRSFNVGDEVVGDEVAGFGEVARVEVVADATVRVRTRKERIPGSPALTIVADGERPFVRVTVEGSADEGATWEELAVLEFAASGRQRATIDEPPNLLRVRCSVAGAALTATVERVTVHPWVIGLSS